MRAACQGQGSPDWHWMEGMGTVPVLRRQEWEMVGWHGGCTERQPHGQMNVPWGARGGVCQMGMLSSRGRQAVRGARQRRVSD
jgi:hypothetical protein